jgi:anti-sigma regulatory factor (Ser/Thr protein kinase)
MTSATAPAHRPAPGSADWAKDDDANKTAVRAATSYAGTFPGQAEEAARVRREIAAYLDNCPVTQDMTLIASELATNAILHTRSRGSTLQVRCQLSACAAWIEVEDLGGPWRHRNPSDRPHGLDIIAALTGPGGWGTQPTGAGGRIVWARLSW